MPDMFCCGFYVAIPSRGPVRVNMISYEVVWSYNFWFVTSKPTVWRPFWLNMLILFDFPLKKNVLRSENCHMIPNDHMNACGEGYRYLASMYNTKTTVLTLLGASLAHFILIFGWLDPLFSPYFDHNVLLSGHNLAPEWKKYDTYDQTKNSCRSFCAKDAQTRLYSCWLVLVLK